MFTKEIITEYCHKFNFKEFQIHMDNGDTLTITPCTYGPNPTMDTIEYWLVYGPLPWMGANTLDELVNQLNRYETTLAEAAEEKIRLKKFFDEHIDGKNADDDTQSYYSDWHKDVFGFRPRYNCYGIHR